MAGASGFVWVVANFRALLLAKQRFDGGIDVEYPGRIECCGYAAHEVCLEPDFTGGGFNARKATTHRIAACDLVHLEHVWADTIAAQCGDVGITFMPG